MFDFLPSTRRLFEALEFEWPDPENEEQADDQYPIDAALSDLQNRLYGNLPEAVFKEGTWPASPAALDAMRAALADQRGTRAGDLLAYTLARSGCTDPATISGLSTWDSQLFRWREARLGARDLLGRFKDAGAAGNPDEDDLRKLDAWLANPGAVLAHYSSGNLTGTLLKGRAATGSLYDNGGCPEYARLFEALSQLAGLPVSNVAQTPGDDFLDDASYGSIMAEVAATLPAALREREVFGDPETIWRIDFRLGGTPATTYVTGSYSWVNDLGIALRINRMLADLGRNERVLRLGDGRNDEGSFWGNYVVAEPAAFTALCADLDIPLRSSAEWSTFP